MKKLFKKIIRSSIVILIFWIVVCGIVYAQQQACCITIVDTCNLPFDRVPDSYAADSSFRVSPSHHRNSRLQSIHFSENFLADFDAKNACCKTNCCDRYNQGTYFNASFPR